MGFGLLIAVAIVAFVAIGYFQYQARLARIRALTALATSVGFTFSVDDTENLIGFPFELFERGDGRTIENVMAGRRNDLSMRFFDYTYYDTHTDGKGNRSRSYRYFTCGVMQVAATCAPMRLTHEGFFSKLGAAIGLHDMEFEYDEFNQRFKVQCADQRFAFSLVDGAMMEWLLQCDGFEVLELDGPMVLVAGDKLDPADWLSLGIWLEQFHSHIPPVVFTTYPPT